MAEDGYLPRALARRDDKTGAPRWSIVVCAVAWCLALGLGFERLVELDVLLYGFSLLLEFVSLAVLRVREPELPRGFRVPGGTVGAALIGVAPMALLGVALWKTVAEQGFTRGLAVGLALIAAGPVIYAVARRNRRSLGSG
jgi:amino acid transporter